ncbi:MAG TPA: C40 family peptidase [Chitinophagales bacterium]|nr:C40 family peptidase [Chitinophagales bacterium]
MESFGIIILSHVSIKSESSHKSETITQGIFGEVFKILEIQKEWTKIQLLSDSYIGFIQNQQWIKVENFNDINFYINSKNNLSVNWNEIKLHLPIGARIWKNDINHPVLSQFTFSKKANYKKAKSKYSPKLLQKAAKKFLGAPYLWGGKTTVGIDCSGFVQIVFLINGIQLPRDAYQQAEIGKIIPINECRVGDLAFFSQSSEKITHVGIIYDVTSQGIKIIHSSAFVRIDSLDEKGISYTNLQNELVYSHHLKFIKRAFLS